MKQAKNIEKLDDFWTQHGNLDMLSAPKKSEKMSNKLRFWGANVVFWGVYYAINGTSFLLYLTYEPYDRILGLATLVFWILLFTGFYAFIYHHFQFNNKNWRFQVIQILISALIVFELDSICFKHLNHLIFPFIQGVDTFSEDNYYIKLLFNNKSKDEINALFSKLNQHNDNMKIFAILTWLSAYNLIQYHILLRKTQVNKLEIENHLKDAELTNLRQQLNPHFLFNSLNVLSSLTHESPERAEIFVDELSKVYRYLLHSNEQELVTVSNELGFIRSYFHLLETRYEKGVFLEINIEKESHDKKLPTLALQILVENAVKHNEISPEKPLKIEIGEAGGHLFVRNNIQPKTTKPPSNQIGLGNLEQRYKLLGVKGFGVRHDLGEFEVTLPLLGKD